MQKINAAIMAKQLGLFYPTCQESAWDQIKDRKGRLENGVFVKEVPNTVDENGVADGL
jgi:hypothetical protein